MDRAEACGGLNTAIYYSNTVYGLVGNGTQIYLDAAGTTVPPQPFIHINGNSYANVGGLLSAGAPC
jgi:hypothetical protein